MNGNILVIPGTGRDSALSDPKIKSRELFISNASDTYPVKALRYVLSTQCNVHVASTSALSVCNRSSLIQIKQTSFIEILWSYL